VSWTNILAPVLGDDPDADVLAVAMALAKPFRATITAAYSAAEPTRLFAWACDPGIGVTDMALGEFRRVATAEEDHARVLLATLGYRQAAFANVTAENWLGLRAASRLADVVVWPCDAARGRGFFAGAFQHILVEEGRPVLVSDRPVMPGGVVAVAWDGGPASSRAARRAIPWLQMADQVVILTAPHDLARPCEPGPLIAYLASRGIQATASPLHSRGDAGPLLLEAARSLGARLLVAGAFGHPRLQRFIFGGTTQVLLDAAPTRPMFLSH
jgi:nucleotide-binding universal stress UspA family protein